MADKTIVSVPSQDSNYSLPGLWAEADLRSTYSDAISGLASMTATQSDATGPEGVTRTFIFSPRTGQKG